jgi:hypothetical protein
MDSSVRRYEGIGMVRSEEVTKKGRELAAEPAAGMGRWTRPAEESSSSSLGDRH